MMMADGQQNDESLKRKRFTMFPRHSERNLRRNSKVEDVENDGFNAHPNHLQKNEELVDENELNFSPHQPEPKKSRGRPQKQHWTHEWSDKATETLINLWSTKEELYNKAHPEFYVRESKDRAVAEIKSALNDRGFNVTENNILSKFQSLRTYFCTQRTKFTSTKKSNSNTRYGGCSGMDEGESKWRFYKSLMFLDDNMKQRDSTQRRPTEFEHRFDLKNDFDTSMVATPSFAIRNSMVSIEQPFRDYDPTPDFLRDSPELNSIHTNNTMDSTVGDPTRMIDETSPNTTTSCGDMNSLVKQKHEDFLFGELVGNMIHQLPQGQHKDVIKLEIQQLIIKAKYTSTTNNNHIEQSTNSNNNISL